MAEKVTFMKLKVDLECKKCYKKVKKLLSKYPQIRDEKFDEKQNIVMITVVCCSPEKIRDKLCCKGGGSIKSIEIVPDKKKEPEKEKEKEKKKPKAAETKKDPEKKKEADKPKPKPTEPEKKKEADKPKADPPKKESDKPKTAPPNPGPKIPDPVPAYPPVPPQPAVPVGICCAPCYDGRLDGPCYNGYGGPVLRYDGYYARPVYDSYGGGRPYYVSRCDQYFSDENASGCTIM